MRICTLGLQLIDYRLDRLNLIKRCAAFIFFKNSLSFI